MLRKKAVVYLTTAHHINMRTGQTVCKVRESIPVKKILPKLQANVTRSLPLDIQAVQQNICVHVQTINII